MRNELSQPILVVDDDQESLAYAESTLKLAGLEVSCALTALSARRRLAEQSFALVLADLKLPDESGLDVLKAARERDPLAVGIIWTGYASMDTALDALRSGVYDYLFKPCPPDALLASVRRGLEHHQLKSALIQKTQQVEKLAVALDDKSRLIQNISHELKNPLSVVYGYAAFLLKQSEKCAPEDVKKSLVSIHNNAERLNYLLEDLSESSRLSSRKLELKRRVIAAAELVREAAEGARFMALKKGLSLSWNVADERVFVDADGQRIHQVLSNLLSNAIKFTPSPGKVRVAAQTAGNEVVFSISDTGVGIPAEHIPHLFERFYQAKQSALSANSGLGLGLEIAKGLIELHGGRIWVESAPQKGSTFFFTLPVAAPQGAAPLTIELPKQ